ncbi:MAG: hypothetical protein Q9178_002464 [Gyalolechia marmorata]
MGKKSKNLSHEEIWDDSALVDSWDAALQEYQLYHSIHARGERVEDVLRAAEVPEELPVNGTVDMSNNTTEDTNGMPHLEEAEDGEVEDGEIEDDTLPDAGTFDETRKMELPADQEHFSPPTAVENSNQSVPESSAVPTALNMGVQDEGLKNLMMSWYYAGYYTGLYEGRKQSEVAVPQPINNGQSKR